MARRAGRANVGWGTLDSPHFTWEQVQVEVLMDIRYELQRLNGLLACPNFMAIPRKLERIARNTAKKRKPARAQSRGHP